MYTRVIYEPESRLALRIPGYGSASAGSRIQQTIPERAAPSTTKSTGGSTFGTYSTGGSGSGGKKNLPALPQNKQTWLTEGSFGDGYQRGDLARGLTGTILDTTQNVFAGAARIGETTIDSLAGRIAGVGLFEDELSEFVKRDLINEEAVGGLMAKFSLPGLAGEILGVDPERDSFLGEKGDSLAQSAGQYVFTRGLNSVGIPGEAVSGVISYGGEMENALRQGATPREANISADISARGEILSEKLSGGIKFGGAALDDVLVDYVSDRISNKFWLTLTKAVLGGIGEGNEEIASEMISRFGQWITYQDDKTIQEMLFSGEAREAYLDSFLSAFALGFPSAGIDTVLLANRGHTGKAADAALDIPAPAVPVGTLTDGGLRGVKALVDGKASDIGAAAADGGARAAEILKTQEQMPSAPQAQLEQDKRTQSSQPQTDAQVPHLTTDTWTNNLDGEWTENVDTQTDTDAVPIRYEDALRDYMESGLD